MSLLYEEAVSAGLRERDVVERLMPLLSKLAKPYTSVNLAELLPESSPTTREGLERAIRANLAQSQNNGFFLFIDDTDQIAAPDRPGHLNRIWGFLLAARELSQRIDRLRCIVSLREEVWRRLMRDHAGQRDQADHFVSLVQYLNPTREHIRQIVERRMALANVEAGGSETAYWRTFFEEECPKIPMTERLSSWPDLIVIRSRERPRDAVQLINALAQRASLLKRPKITEVDFAAEIIEFSKQRTALLAQEAEFECKELETIMKSFAEVKYDRESFKATAEVIREHLGSLGGRCSVTLFGRGLNLGNDDDRFELWHYLFDLGFLNARVSDSREKDGYRHIFPREDPGLVSRARWNDMQATVWEIGPAYRDYLIGIQRERQAQFGLPPIRKKPSRRGHQDSEGV
jgi:hypothetical protein